MNVRALTLGAVLGFAVAVIPSCGTPPCGPANCNGCCDTMNKCVPSSAASSNTSCGSKGAACANCATNNQVCNTTSFVCENATGAGGGTGGGATGGGATGGGGTTGGGTTGGGGATGGGTTGGGTGTTPCDVMAQNCTGAGESCLYIDLNGNGRCFTGTCDVVTQNCPTATDKCSYAFLPDGGSARACAPAGSKTEGQSCGPTADDCAKGLICVNGSCRKFCYTDNNCGGGLNICGNLVQVPNSPEMPATCVMLQACDPLLQNCPAMQGCALTVNGPACLPEGNVANGGMCGQMAGCVKGSTCLGPSTSMLTCHSFCNLDGGAPNCPTGQCGFILDMQMNRLAWGACQ
ncbi:MAG: hypothetical protein QM817_21330 [Archangium sp.]